MKMLTRVAAGLAALVWAGCQSTPERRIAGEAEAFAAMPAEVQAKIRAGEVALFFTPKQVELAMGKPDRVSLRTSAEGEQEVWIYERGRTGWSFGVGVGGGSGGVGGGVGVGTGGRAAEVVSRVVFTGGVVSAVEKVAD